MPTHDVSQLQVVDSHRANSTQDTAGNSAYAHEEALYFEPECYRPHDQCLGTTNTMGENPFANPFAQGWTAQDRTMYQRGWYDCLAQMNANLRALANSSFNAGGHDMPRNFQFMANDYTRGDALRHNAIDLSEYARGEAIRQQTNSRMRDLDEYALGEAIRNRANADNAYDNDYSRGENLRNRGNDI